MKIRFTLLLFLIFPSLAFADSDCSKAELELSRQFYEARLKLYEKKTMTIFELNEAKFNYLSFQYCSGALSKDLFCEQSGKIAEDTVEQMKKAYASGYTPYSLKQKLDLILKIRQSCGSSTSK